MTENEEHFIRRSFNEGTNPEQIGLVLFLGRKFKEDPHTLHDELRETKREVRQTLIGKHREG